MKLKPTVWTVALAIVFNLSLVAEDAPKATETTKSAEVASTNASAAADPLAGVPMEKVSYYIGRNIGRQMSSQGFKPDFESLKLGLQDAVEKKDSRFSEDELRSAMEKFTTGLQKMEDERMAKSSKACAEFLTTNGKKKGVTTTASGLQYEVLKAGDGAKPAATDTVKVNYRGTLVSGEEFDSSYARNEPAEFPLNGVIKGWTEGLQLMSKGSKFKFVIPGDLAYGERGSPPKIGPNETLVFEVELLEINGK